MRKDAGKRMSRNGEIISRSLVITSPSLLTSRIVNGGRSRRRLQEMAHSMKKWYSQALKRTSVITDKHERIAAKSFLSKCRGLLRSMITVRRRRRRQMQQHMLNNDENNQLRIGGSRSSDITISTDGVMMEKTTNHKLVLFYACLSYFIPSFPSIGVIAWIAHHTTLSAVRLLCDRGNSTRRRQIDHCDDDTRTTFATAIERRNTINVANNGSNNDRFMTNVRSDWIAHDWIHLFELNADFTESYAHLCILLQTLNNNDEIAERRERLRNKGDSEEDTENENDNKIYSSIVFDHLFIWNNIIPLLTAVDATSTTTTWFLPNLFTRKRQIERETERQFERSQYTSAIVAEKKIQHYKYSCSWIPNE